MSETFAVSRDPFPGPARLQPAKAMETREAGPPVDDVRAPLPTSDPAGPASPASDRRGLSRVDQLILSPSVNGGPAPSPEPILPVAPAPVPSPIHPDMPLKPEVPGQVGKWIHEAKTILVKRGYHPRQIDARAIALMIRHESGGNPRAINTWDYNAQIGTPSKGIMQVIQPTFNAYKLKGYGDIYNPVHNIIAGVRYAIARYGSLSQVPGVRAHRQGRAYRGY